MLEVLKLGVETELYSGDTLMLLLTGHAFVVSFPEETEELSEESFTFEYKRVIEDLDMDDSEMDGVRVDHDGRKRARHGEAEKPREADVSEVISRSRFLRFSLFLTHTRMQQPRDTSRRAASTARAQPNRGSQSK